jgi:hypothetical protein
MVFYNNSAPKLGFDADGAQSDPARVQKQNISGSVGRVGREETMKDIPVGSQLNLAAFL